jgi:hypothetical protein
VTRHRSFSVAPSALSLAAIFLLVACDGCGSEPANPPSEAETASSGSSESRPVGTVEGVVRFAEGAELPAYPPMALARSSERPDLCPPQRPDHDRPVRMGGGRGLEGVLVAAHGFVEEDVAAPEPQVRDIAIRGCQLTPALVVGVRGDTLRITNEDDHPFLPTMPGTNQFRALMEGQTRDIPLDEGNVFPIECTFAAPCGRTDVIVSYHPVYAVTGEGGRYRIENVPADADLSIHAFHPLFSEATVEVRVGAGETVQRDLVIGTATLPTPPAEGAEDDDGPEAEAGADDDDSSDDDSPAEDRPGLF